MGSHFTLLYFIEEAYEDDDDVKDVDENEIWWRLWRWRWSYLVIKVIYVVIKVKIWVMACDVSLWRCKTIFCCVEFVQLDNSKLGSTQKQKICCQDHILTENIWCVCSKTSYCGDERRCYRCRTTERTITEDRATQPREAGGWVSPFFLCTI